MSEERCAHRWEGPPFEGDECGREERDPSHHHAGGGYWFSHAFVPPVKKEGSP